MQYTATNTLSISGKNKADVVESAGKKKGLIDAPYLCVVSSSIDFEDSNVLLETRRERSVY